MNAATILVLVAVVVCLVWLAYWVHSMHEATRTDERATMVHCLDCDRVFYVGQPGSPDCDTCFERRWARWK